MRSRCSYLSFSVVALSCVLIGQLHADDEADRNELVYKSIESTIRGEFDEAMRVLEQKGKEKGSTSVQLEDARGGIKVMMYNKAYNYYLCLKEGLKNGNPSEASLSECYRPRNLEIAKFVTKMIDYEPLVGVEVFKRCGLGARLFDAEFEFKPYSFLDHPEAKLYDYEKYNQCIINAAK